MNAFFLATIKESIRTNAVRGFLLLLPIVLLSAWMSSNFSGRAPATIAMDVGLSLTHFVFILLALLWSHAFYSKDFERRIVLSLFAYPVNRSAYLLGRLTGTGFLIFISVVTFGIALALLTYALGLNYPGQRPPNTEGAYIFVLLFMFLDVMVVMSFTWLIATISVTPMLPFALGFAFAWVSHALGPALDYLRSGVGEAEALSPTFLPLLDFIRWVIPDLSKTDVRHLALYNLDIPYQELMSVAIMCLAYIGMMIGTAIIILRARNFD